MTNTLNQKEIMEEITVELRNADILTTTQRGVSTTSESLSISGTALSITGSNIKNVRSVSAGGASKTFGTDYTVNYDNSGYATITFTATQTGTCDISYDYGDDKIYPGYPRTSLKISDFPRIAIDFIDISTENGGFGNVNLNRYDLSVTVYSPKKDEVRTYVESIRAWIISNMNSLYYSKLIKPTLIGPLVPASFDRTKDRIFQQNIDFTSSLNLEKN